MATEVPCSANSACAADGPVMTMMNKRLRALRKKYNRILQMEDRVAHGKPLNKEQEELLRSKLAVSVLIEEYEHLRQPIYDSLQEELSLAIAASKREAAKDVKEKEEEKKTEAEVVSNVMEEKEDGAVLSAVEDLLHLLYFGNLFDLKFLDSDFDMMLYTRTHERTSCISYDSVTDDTTRVLQEEDLDMISALRTLILSRPSSSDFSHKNALSDCIHHAKLWLQNSDQLILPGSSYSYAGLREHVNKILGSDYTTATPEVKPSVDLAAEVGYGNTQAQMNEMYESAPVGNAASHSEHYQHHYEADHSEIKGEISHSENLNSGEVTLSQHELEKLTIRDQGHNELQSHPDDSREFVPPRNYPNNYRANHRGGGGRRYGGGYSNGRGGRGGRGGFQNGRAAMYYDGGYYMRGNTNNYNSRGGGRGGSARGGSGYGGYGGPPPVGGN